MQRSIDRDRFLDLVVRHKTFFRFLLTGGINTIVDILLFFVFANLLYINPIAASILSTGLTLILSYLLNRYFVFRSSKSHKSTVPLFIVVTLVNVWLFQSLVMAIALTAFDGNPYFDSRIWTLNLLAKLCGVTVSTILNYLSYKLLFKEK